MWLSFNHSIHYLAIGAPSCRPCSHRHHYLLSSLAFCTSYSTLWLAYFTNNLVTHGHIFTSLDFNFIASSGFILSLRDDVGCNIWWCQDHQSRWSSSRIADQDHLKALQEQMKRGNTGVVPTTEPPMVKSDNWERKESLDTKISEFLY